MEMQVPDVTLRVIKPKWSSGYETTAKGNLFGPLFEIVQLVFFRAIQHISSALNISLAYLAFIGAYIIVTSISHIAYLNGHSVTFTSHISPNRFACGNKLDCWRLPP